MVLKSKAYILVTLACIYVVCVIVLANRAVIKLCLPSTLYNTKDKDEVVLKFDVRLSKSGLQETTLENDNTRINVLRQRKMYENKVGPVKSEEIIFIDRKEYQDGTIRLDETKIKQQIKRSRNLEVDTLRKMFNISKNSMPPLKVNPKSDKKYLFALRYYEQLAMATKNFFSLASLATATGRSVVQPFVNNSRFSGLPTGVSYSRFKESNKKFSDMHQYFDEKHLKYQMKNRGYSDLATFDEFQRNCPSIDVVVHFLYKDPNTDRDLSRWYKISDSDIDDVHRRVKTKGWTECDFVKESRIDKFLGDKKVSRYVCVDPEIIKTSLQLQKLVLKDAKCSAIISWKGNGTKRTHFNIAPQINELIKPFEVKHSQRLIDIAYDYIRNTIKRPFISVHVRIERHVKWKGMTTALACINKLSKAISKRKSRLNLKKIFLAHDLGDNGSDTLQHFTDKKSMAKLESELESGLNNPFRFDPMKYGLYDRGAIAIVEMHIMALGESLFTLGKGNFQQWVTKLFLLQNAEDKSLVYKVCELGDKRK